MPVWHDGGLLVFGIITVLALIGAMLVAGALLRLFRGRFLAAMVRGAFGAKFLLLASLLAAIALNLHTYRRLTAEQTAAEIVFYNVSPQYFSAEIRYPDGTVRLVDLRGDEWQLDARILRWRPFARLFGFDTVYRFERISGRYRDLAQERSAERSVHALTIEEELGIDVWNAVRRHHAWLPAVDAVYGSAVYLPMADQARYRVSVGSDGLIARPANEAAQAAVAGWSASTT